MAEEVKTALTEAKKAQPTWASVTSAVALIASDPGVPKKVVPPRLSREILVRGNNLPASLAKRTP